MDARNSRLGVRLEQGAVGVSGASDDRPVRLVCFDLGRVLVRICDDWRHACEVAGVPAPRLPTDIQSLAKLHEAVCGAEVGELDLPAFAAAVAPLLDIPPERVFSLSNAYLLGPFPGAVELLDELCGRGIATACLTNTNDNHWRLLSQPGNTFLPLDRLTHRFASHLIRARKPDEAIYRHVEQATGAHSGEIVFFDDVVENVESARRVGWRAHRIDPTADDPVRQIRRVLDGIIFAGGR